MAGHRRTDHEPLRRLLASGKLSTTERTAVHGMLRDLMSGKLLELNTRERLWLTALEGTCKIAATSARSARMTNEDAKRDAAAALDAMARPKRPPGK